MKSIWDEFKLIFNNPRDIHRVLMVIPLAALLSHVVYMYFSLPKGVPIQGDVSLAILLCSVPALFLSAWVLLSNPLDIELSTRFLWSALLSAGAHRLYVGVEALGSPYLSAIGIAAIMMVMIFVVTGKTKNELKIWLSVKLNENKDDKETKLRAVNGGTDTNQHTGTG
jgi:hypothetical protein